jgi:hypothetical protein
MKLNVYAIYDNTAKAYMQPFYMHNHALAVRAFTDQVNSEQDNPIKNHPDQFTLFHIGEFDDKTGNLELREHQSLGKALSYKKETTYEKTNIAFEEFKQWLKENWNVNDHEKILKEVK